MTPSLALLCASIALSAAPTPQAKAAFERGEKSLSANQFADAERAYREAIAASPGYAEALNGLGSALFRQNRRDEAIQQFRAATAADPSFALAWFNLGFAARKANDFASAAKAYETYTRLKSDDPDGFYGLAESYRALGRRTEAIAAYEEYVRREKRPSEQKWVERAQQSVAQLKAEVEAEAQAKAKVAEAARAAPPAPTKEVAKVEPRTSQPTLAREKIEQGDQLLKEKKYREASLAYQDAVNADSANVEALFKLGNSYAYLEYYAQAIDRWNRVIELKPGEKVVAQARDNIARAEAKMAKAGGSSPQAAGKPPGSGPVAQSTLKEARAAYDEGVKQIHARDYSGAVKSLTRAIELNPSIPQSYIARGSAHVGLRQYPEAAADYQYALKLRPELAAPLYGLAEAFRSMGRTAEARTYYERYASSTARDVQPQYQQRAREQAAALR